MDTTPHFPIYMDYGATTPVDPRVVDAMIPWLREHFGNPASRSHAWGWEAEEIVEKSRGQVAELMVSVGQRVEEAAPLLKLANLQELTVELQVPVQQAQGLQLGQAVQVLPAGMSSPDAGSLPATVVSIAPLLDERTQSVTVRARLRQTASGSLRVTSTRGFFVIGGVDDIGLASLGSGLGQSGLMPVVGRPDMG
mgnify:CR=1 FL=1